MFSVTTVCHKTNDTRHPLLMLTNSAGNRYFFGKVPEGAQRALNENGFRMSKVQSIFMTGTLTLWSEIGGVPGLFLTVSDAMSRGLDVYVSSSAILKYIVATWRYFVYRRDCPLNVIATQEKGVIADSTVAFFPVHIAPEPINNALGSDMDNVHNENDTAKDSSNLSTKALSQIEKLTSLMFPTSSKTASESEPNYNGLNAHVHLPEFSKLVSDPSQKSVSYIIRFLPTRGKFDPVRAKELGIKPGVDFKRLTSGELVVSSTGETVYPHQVMGAAKSFSKVAVIDIPDRRYMTNTISSPEWFKQSEDRGSEQYGLVYHFLGDDIDFQLDEYLRFVTQFPAECTHVISHSSIADNSLVFKTSGIHLLKLKTILKNNFNLPFISKALSCPAPFVKLQALQTYKIDASGIREENVPIENATWPTLFDRHVKPSNPEAILDEKPVPIGPIKNAQSLKDQVQVVTLGTGSALPSIHRNVLSNLVRIPYIDSVTNETKFRAVLLDGGENTIGQLLRNYGHNQKEQLRQIFDELGLIFLSHLHADHNLGIISVITSWLDHNATNDRKLYLVIPYQYEDFLREWYQLENRYRVNDFHRICFISCGQLLPYLGGEVETMDPDTFEQQFDKKATMNLPKVTSRPLSNAVKAQLASDTSIIDLKTCAAIHCNYAYSVSMKFKLSEDETFKISFSGDTRPNVKFVELGMDSDVLIHEASLDDVNIEEALEKKHTTVVEAVRVAQLMKCRKVILTHFSTRFSEESNFIISAEDFDALATRLDEYLGQGKHNVFSRSLEGCPLFNDLDICYAYDLMAVRFNDFAVQRPHFQAIQALSLAQDSKEQMKKDEKKERRQIKLAEKREVKRQQRLGAGK